MGSTGRASSGEAAVGPDHRPELVVAVDDAEGDDVRALLTAHLAFARSVTPPEDVHAASPDAMSDPRVTILTARRSGVLVGVVALRCLEPGHGELKAMHTVAAARGGGVGRALVDHAVALAAGRGWRRVSLETGTMEGFAPARRLYARIGFVPCGPFGEHRAHPGSTCMVLELPPDARLDA